MITALLLSLAPLLPQSEFEDTGWELVDGVALHLDDRIVLFSELEAAMRRNPAFQSPELTGQDRQSMQLQLIEELENLKLEVQAGRNEGFDPQRIEQVAKSQILESKDKLGAAKFSDQLRANGASIEQLSRDQADSLYSRLWRSKQLGEDLGFTERLSRDRYIRPGMLKSIFRVSRDLINPGTVEFRFFVLGSAAVGGEEFALEWMEGVQKRVTDGEDFASIVTAEASEERANGGLQPAIEIPRIGIPELREFATSGKLGEFSPIIRLPAEDQTVFLMARLEDRVDQVEPDFEDGELQNDFRQRIKTSVDQRLLGSAHKRLRSRANIWIHPALAGALRAPQP